MIDFRKIVGESRLYNFHSHTQFCDGRSPMADFVDAALAEGFTHWGFSPHSPVPVASPCNMKREDVADYVAEFERLREMTRGQINLYLSMEIDYLGDEWGPSHPYFDTLPLDYRIGSVHFIKTPAGDPIDIDGPAERFAGYVERYFNGDLRSVVERYFDSCEAMVEAGGLDMIGHFDKILMNGETIDAELETRPWYKARVERLMSLIARSGITVEINTKSLESRGRFSPDLSLWPRLRSLGVPMVVNSDAHYPSLINAGRDQALEALSRLAVDNPVD